MDLGVTVSDQAEEDFPQFLQAHIRDFNDQVSPAHRQARVPGSIVPLHLAVSDGDGRLVGGLSGNTYWDWLEIDYFYLPTGLRGGGLGSSLLRRAARAAVERGCRAAFATTFGFQAKVFYEKHGYQVVGTLEGYPPGSEYHWMRKDLDRATPPEGEHALIESGTPATIPAGVNDQVLSYLEPLSAHDDVAEALTRAVSGLGDVQTICPDRDAFRYVAVATGGVIFGFAVGMSLVGFRLLEGLRPRALSTGGRECREAGDHWVSFGLVRADWPEPDLEFWARRAYVFAREHRGGSQ